MTLGSPLVSPGFAGMLVSKSILRAGWSPYGVWGSCIPTCGQQEKHGVVALEPGFNLPVLEPVRDHFAVRRDFPLP